MRPTISDLGIPGLDRIFVAGEWMKPSSAEIVDVLFPATGETVAQVALITEVEADRAVEAASAAFDDGNGAWALLDIAERAQVCRRFCAEIEARLDRIKPAWVLESGPTMAYSETLNQQIAPMVWNSALEAAKSFVKEELRKTPTGGVIVSHEPAGVVLAVYAYNGPLIYVGMKVIPALLAGCSVILKPAQESQLTSKFIAEAAEQAGFPAGVVSVLPAGPEVTQHLVGHPQVDLVSLTAGTAIARDVISRTGPRIGRTLLELGGKSAALIIDDADLSTVIPQLVPSAIGYCGQTCITLSRVLASRARYQEVVDALAAAYSAVRLGDPFDSGVDLGPLGAERARARSEAAVAGALAAGARVASGGRRPEGLEQGWYFEPTLLADVTNDMDVARNEIFGPVTCVIAYEDEDDAVRIANDSPFGLAATVFCGEEARGQQLARRVRAGAVTLNMTGMCITEPYGGFKQSGFGREGGVEGIYEYTEIRQLLFGGGSLWGA